MTVHMLFNPRYEAYLITTSKPTNWGYMAFISAMKRAYTGECSVFGKRIDNHDNFTDFIRTNCYLYKERENK